ncbi:MAG TPA: tetratricopeptide repeat protein [Ktedonobacteraceae bacterium]|nr:tetratricopeptide repeat protein [Ktedonobacteraceae bacterium]
MQQPAYFTFGISIETPPSIDGRVILTRNDEVAAVIDLLSDAITRTVLITGTPGVGKSLLAALVFQHIQRQTQEGIPGFQHCVWLRLGPRTTWPDLVNALLNALQLPGRQNNQISQHTDLQVLYDALRRPGQGVLIVLDQCEELFDRAIESTNQSSPYTTGVGLSSAVRFLEMLQQDMGESRFLLTCTKSPYGSDYREAPGVREHQVGGLTIVEGINLLQQKNSMGLQQDLSAVWQRCSGHTYALVLFSSLKNLSGLSLHYLLNSPLYQILWEGDITRNLAEAVVGFLSPVQMSLMRALCLFREAIPLIGLIEVVTGERGRLESDLQLYEQEIKTLVNLGLIEQVRRYDNEAGYQLHEILSTYILSHYLESEQRKASSYLSSSLGVANQPGPLQANQEARKIALAAGHIRVANYYQRVAQQITPPRQKRTHPNEATPFLAMLEHLCLGWRWQAAYDQLCALGMDEDLMRWEIWHTLIGLYEMLLPPTGSLKRRDEGLVCSALGMVYSRLGEFEQSRTYYTSALAIQQDMGDHQSMVITLINQGEFLRTLGDLSLARENLEQAHALMQSLNQPELTCVLNHNMALLCQQEGNQAQSQSYFTQALQLAMQMQDRERQAMIMTNLGLLLCSQGSYQDGLTLLLSALPIRQALRDPGVQNLLIFLGKIEQRMGNTSFANLRQAAQADGTQEQVLQKLTAMQQPGAVPDTYQRAPLIHG